jgi:hypothetical protein
LLSSFETNAYFKANLIKAEDVVEMIKFEAKLAEFKVGLRFDHMAYALVTQGFKLPSGFGKVVSSSTFTELISKNEAKFNQLVAVIETERKSEERKRSRSRSSHKRS